MKIGETPNIHGRHLWIGDYGCGKTYMLGQMHNELKKNGSKGLYLMDTDIGHKTLKSAGIADDMEFDMFTGKGAYVRWSEKLKEFADGNQGFGGLSIDSITSLEKHMLKHIMTVIAAEKDRPLGFLPSLQDQGALVNMLEGILPYLQAISLHMEVIMTAHLQLREDEITNVAWYLPSIVGKKLPSKLGSYFNEVWVVNAEKKSDAIERTVQTATFNRFKCKTQVKDMPLTLPTHDAIKLAVKAYEIGETLTMDEEEAQAVEVVKEEEKPVSILDASGDPNDPRDEPTREELVEQMKG